eukprot:757938-Hanusia_phi.AAC.1
MPPFDLLIPWCFRCSPIFAHRSFSPLPPLFPPLRHRLLNLSSSALNSCPLILPSLPLVPSQSTPSSKTPLVPTAQRGHLSLASLLKLLKGIMMKLHDPHAHTADQSPMSPAASDVQKVDSRESNEMLLEKCPSPSSLFDPTGRPEEQAAKAQIRQHGCPQRKTQLRALQVSISLIQRHATIRTATGDPCVLLMIPLTNEAPPTYWKTLGERAMEMEELNRKAKSKEGKDRDNLQPFKRQR